MLMSPPDDVPAQETAVESHSEDPPAKTIRHGARCRLA